MLGAFVHVEAEAAAGEKLTAYAYPFGLYSELSESLLKELGVKVTLTTHWGSNIIKRGEPESLYLLKRFSIDNMPAEELLKIIASAGESGNFESGEDSDD